MAAKKKAIALLWYAKTAKGWQRVPLVTGPNGRIKFGWGMVDGQPTHLPGGRFQLRFYDGPRLCYENAGATAAEAQTSLQRRGYLLEAKGLAKSAGVKVVVEEQKRQTIRKAAEVFIADSIARGTTESHKVARVAIDEFLGVTSKEYVDQIDRNDVLQYHASLRKRGMSARTVANKDARLRAFLRFSGVDVKTALPPKPRFETKLPTIYSKEQIGAILAAANEYLRTAIELGLKCGLREQEIIHLEWADIDFTHSVLRVRSKPLYGFKVKDSEERDIPVPSDLLRLLKERRGDAKPNVLVLPAERGGPNKKLLRLLKALAKKSGLNCGHCEGCQGVNKECQQWQLHKLRRTYGTTLLRNGVDLATVQRFMGHSDLQSTMRYLQPAGAKEAHASINAISWT